MKWIFFSYTLPTKPSRHRVYVWRQLRKLGAASYQSLWILPFSNERVNELKRLMKDIEGFKGQSLIIDGKALDKTQEHQINQAFLASRNEDYQELIKKCDDYFQEIEKETREQNFIFAEVEENEEELEKLKHWLKKIEKRDFMGAPLRKTALEKMKVCEKVFEDFAHKVYEFQKLK
jgi:vacuolar-type H+-ATPase subunit I/STV1